MRYRIASVLAACIAGLAGVSMLLSGCSGVSNGPVSASGGGATTMSGQAADARLAEAINGFGFELLSSSGHEASVNPVISPASVHAALSMTTNGATGETLQEMRGVLKTDGMSADDANGAWQRLTQRLTSSSGRSQTLDVANALVGRKDVEFKHPFAETNRRSFGARLLAMDFERDDVAGAVNRWFSAKTHGMIPKMLDATDPEAVLYLLNAVYFKGEWVTEFDKGETYPVPFTHAAGVKTPVQMMHLSEPLPYAETPVFQATRVPYKGDATDFYVVLPKPGVGTAAALKTLSGRGFGALRHSLTASAPTEVRLGLPRLDSGFSAELSRPLSGMGMPRAFESDRAQFSAMADFTPLYVASALHATRVKVDEKGTEAAAATVVTMAGAMPDPSTPKMTCDRPYIFAIVDRESGAMLFLGVVNDPTAK